MRPTLNPEGSNFSDIVLVKLNQGPIQNLVGKVVFAEKRERKLVKRLNKIEGDDCWIESDADNTSKVYYDSHIFGSIPCEAVKGNST